MFCIHLNKVLLRAIKTNNSIPSPRKVCLQTFVTCPTKTAEKNKCVLYYSNTSAIKTSLKKIFNIYLRVFAKGCPILKCHKVVTVRLERYKYKSRCGRFQACRKLTLQPAVWHTPINCGGLAGITGNQRRHVGHVLFLDYIKSAVIG